jgi:hypothetical protein
MVPLPAAADRLDVVRVKFQGWTPEQATFLLNEIYLPQIRNEHKTTRRVIEAVPVGKCG